MRIVLVLAACVALTLVALAQPRGGEGRATYERLCARCHGSDGHGAEIGPDIVKRAAARSGASLERLIRQGLPARGMPGFAVDASDLRSLITFLRTLDTDQDERTRVTVTSADGATTSGLALNRSASDLQLLTDGGLVQLFRRAGDGYRRVTSQTDWTTYHGHPTGNRFSELTQIDASNVSRLAPDWMFTLPDASRLEVTPIVTDGVMYVTNANECYALDAGSGRQLWHYQRPRTRGLAGDAASGINRGVAVAGDRVFMVTDNAHLIALNRFTGALVWETTMADAGQNYGATSAPLVAGNRVISGVSGGDEGIRGFIAAFDLQTGKETWRFWTVPRPGEPGSETWRGRAIAHPCAATWLTGSYDESLDTLYWPTGNPCPDYDGREREGDNLYSDSILALDPGTGRLKWHYQFTPHDLWDWDAQQPPVLVDADWQGEPRRLLLHANRNGFMYVLDRVNGTLLLATPFVQKLTWAREIGSDGRPVLVPNQVPTAAGTKVCPSVEGATNWFSTAYDPRTRLYYVQALEKCSIYTFSPGVWRAGESYYNGTTRRVPGEPGQKVLRAIDISTGRIAWELPQEGPATSWGGVLATAGGIVFVAEDSGAFTAVEASNGTRLWEFQANVNWKASPMTYVFDGRQHVAIAAGPSIISFALVR